MVENKFGSRFISKRTKQFLQHMGLLVFALIVAILLSSCASQSYKPATLAELNYTVEYPEPGSGGLFSGEKGYFELLKSSEEADKTHAN